MSTISRIRGGAPWSPDVRDPYWCMSPFWFCWDCMRAFATEPVGHRCKDERRTP